MATAFDQQRSSSQYAELAFDDRFGLLVDTEWTAREQRRLTQRLRNAKLRYPASLEDVDFTHAARPAPRRGPQSRHRRVDSRASQSLLITGPTGIGKSLVGVGLRRRVRVAMASPRPTSARRGCSTSSRSVAATDRMPGSWRNTPSSISSRSMIGCSAPLTDAERRDLLEVIEDRSERASTLIASQLPPTAWHAAIGEPSVADAICDRLIHQAHRLTLKGPTMRDPGTDAGRRRRMTRRRASMDAAVDPIAIVVPEASWAARSTEQPVDRAASVEIAQNAIPTPAWTAHRTRRPQRPTGPVGLRRKNKMRKMTRLPDRRRTTLTAVVASLR